MYKSASLSLLFSTTFRVQNDVLLILPNNVHKDTILWSIVKNCKVFFVKLICGAWITEKIFPNIWLYPKHSVSLHSLCACGGIGRRARLRI